MGSSERWEERVCCSWAVVWSGRRSAAKTEDVKGNGVREGEKGKENEGEEEEGKEGTEGKEEEGAEEVIGSIGLKPNNVTEIHGQSAEIGYWLSEEFWGKGWMTEVLAGFVEWVWRSFPVAPSTLCKSVHASPSTITSITGDAAIATTTTNTNASQTTTTNTTTTTLSTPIHTPSQSTPWRARGLDRLEAQIFAWNACGSAKVLAKCGFKHAGLLRGKVWKVIEGVERRCDLEVWDSLRDDVR